MGREVVGEVGGGGRRRRWGVRDGVKGGRGEVLDIRYLRVFI